MDFYGDGKPTWALVLLEGKGSSAKAHLVLARRLAQAWEFTSLDETDAAVAPVVWSEGPGEYRDVYEHTTVRAASEVIVFAGYESWAILYAWTGGEIVKVWIAD
ncbi:MAG: hypothetical protein ACRD35_02070 [Candidatus Acidiferrales bacterium]